MKNFTKIFILVGGLVLYAPALAQHKVSGLPDGWQVEVDGTAVTIKDGKTPAIAAGKTVRLINNSGKELSNIVVFKKAVAEFEDAPNIGLVSTLELKDNSSARRIIKTFDGNSESDNDEKGWGNISGILSKIDDAGNVIGPVEWDFELDEIIATMSEKEQNFMKGVKKDLIMSLPFIYTIGDKWLWMCKCNLEYNGDMNQAATIAQEQYGMSGAEVGDLMGRRVSDFIHQYRRHYLVRVSDGAIFPWENAPEKVRGVRGNAMEQRDLYGIVEPFGNGDSIVYINTNRQIVLLYATPAGLQERVLSPSEGTDYTKAMFVAPTNDGYIGTILTNEITMNTINCHGTGEACVFTPDGTRIDIGKYQRYTSDDGTHAKEAEIRDERELCALNGTLYYITRASDSNAAQLREVSISDGKVSIDNIKATWGHPNPNEYESYELHNGITGIPWPVFHSEDGKMVFGASTLIKYDPNGNPAVTFSERPEHYPNGQGDYYNGVAYVMDGYDSVQTGDDPGYIFNNSLPSKIWICDMNKTAAEALDIDWSGLSNDEKAVVDYTALHWNYKGGDQKYVAKASLASGKKVYYTIPVTGENKGKAEILKNGDTKISAVVKIKK